MATAGQYQIIKSASLFLYSHAYTNTVNISILKGKIAV